MVGIRPSFKNQILKFYLFNQLKKRHLQLSPWFSLQQIHFGKIVATLPSVPAPNRVKFGAHLSIKISGEGDGATFDST